jgi:ribosomal protein L7/L12
MTRIVLSGWNTGFNKVGLTKLLRNDLGFSLRHAKSVTDAVLEGHSVTIEVEDDRVGEMAVRLGELGAKFAIDKDAGLQDQRNEG